MLIYGTRKYMHICLASWAYVKDRFLTLPPLASPNLVTFFSPWDFFYFWCGGGMKNITLYVRRFPRWRHPGWVASHCSTHLWETHDGISSSALQTNPIFTKLRFRRNPKSRTHLFLFPPLDANQGRPDVFSILEHEAGPWRLHCQQMVRQK